MASGIKLEREATEVEDQEIKKTFAKLDRNGDGRISVDELVKGARYLGINPTIDDAEAMIQEIDANGNGVIDYSEFVTVMKKQLLLLTQEEKLMRDAFQKFDADKTGFISVENLRKVLGNGRDPLSNEEIDELFKEADVDGDGRINYEVVPLIPGKENAPPYNCPVYISIPHPGLDIENVSFDMIYQFMIDRKRQTADTGNVSVNSFKALDRAVSHFQAGDVSEVMAAEVTYFIYHICCSHVGSILFFLNDYTRQKSQIDMQLPCTSKPAAWKKPRKMNLDPKPINQLEFKKPKLSAAEPKPSSFEFDPRHTNDKNFKPDYYQQKLMELKKIFPKTGPPQQIGQDLVEAIEKRTREQRKCSLWLDLHKGRLTSSRFGDIMSSGECPKSLVSEIVNGSSLVKSEYLNMMEQFGHTITVKKCGLFLIPYAPYIGASCDGIVTDTSLPKDVQRGVLEIKCPFKIQQTFRLIDSNGDGKLSIAEIKRSAQKLGCNPTTDDVKEMIKSVDTDGNAYVTYQEYEEMMRQQLMSLAYEKEVLMRAFKKFDKDGSGHIDASELKHVLRNYGEDKLTEDEVREFFEDFDTNDDGKINIDDDTYVTYEEYKEMMRQHIMTLAYEREVLMRAFQTFDKDGNGYIDKAELKHVLQTRGDDKLTEEETEELFQEFDTDENGKICIQGACIHKTLCADCF
ncbi:hypothetical protein KUTeg_000621 [Tegillarca granosa]|uniref:EF-hand domain-containing protein n=1 Tax=Tegillarca granosa TaxID=220873 RepID=A0ABQ9G0U8_TEGGR|nr:hypothetical protein KUTeg_000621 [Tegillarca granosa]